MRLLAPSILSSVHLIVIAVALYVRGGGTWVLSGYDRERVADEKGLAAWCGNGLASIGAGGLVAAGLLALAPASVPACWRSAAARAGSCGRRSGRSPVW
jgi:hypothetical protein